MRPSLTGNPPVRIALATAAAAAAAIVGGVLAFTGGPDAHAAVLCGVAPANYAGHTYDGYFAGGHSTLVFAATGNTVTVNGSSSTYTATATALTINYGVAPLISKFRGCEDTSLSATPGLIAGSRSPSGWMYALAN